MTETTKLPDFDKTIDALIAGTPLSTDTLQYFLETVPLNRLIEGAHRVTESCASTTFNTCAIINAKADGCSCDCAWCAQSRHWNSTPAETSLVSEEIAELGADRVHRHGIRRYSLVTAGRKLSPRVTREATDLLVSLHRKFPDMELCASFGLMNEKELTALKDAGLIRYHCNLETSDAHFRKVCTTHTRDDKIATLKAAREAGLELCSGGLFGIGEAEADRIELAETLRDLEIPSIPLNFLSPIAGTPLADQLPLSDEEILRTAVIFRLLNPTAYLRLAGGRNRLTEEVVEKLMFAGVNSAIMGDFLTTQGSSLKADVAAAQEAGWELENSMHGALRVGFPEVETTDNKTCRPTMCAVPNTKPVPIKVVGKKAQL